MQHDPGDWYKQYATKGKEDLTGTEDARADYEKETIFALRNKAQDHVASFSVTLTTTGQEHGSKPLKNLNPGSGVLVQVHDRLHGVLTAAHVLRRSGNTRDATEITVIATPRGWGDHLFPIPLSSRRILAHGFLNESEEGPDLAIVPLTSAEWRSLNIRGMVAYNLRKQHLSVDDVDRLGDPTRLISIIHGCSYKASRIVRNYTDSNDVRLTMQTMDTRVKQRATRGGYDYLELPAVIPEDAYPAQWIPAAGRDIPGKAKEEIDKLRKSEGVTQEVWAGISGAGVWNVAVGSDTNGKPNGKVLAKLAGICFYANPNKGCIIAHGDRSIEKIAAEYIRNPDLLGQFKE